MKKRRTLVEANVEPSMRRQCELLGVSRSSLYYEAVGPDAEELELVKGRTRPPYGSVTS